MNILCKLGFHNWEYLESISKEQLRKNIYIKLTKNNYGKNFQIPTGKFVVDGTIPEPLVKKVCLKCSKMIDEITPFENKIIEYYKNQEDRKNKVEMSCSKF